MTSPFFAHPRPAFAKAGGFVCTMAIDAEEDFDWNDPVCGTAYSTACMHQIGDLHSILGSYGVVPAYLLTYPILEDNDVVRLLRRQLDRGSCVAGIQLHSWVNPPYDGYVSRRASFSGNLNPNLEEQKLVALKRKFTDCFGHEPRLYRAGRYGLGGHTAELLEKHGFSVDTSLAPRTTFGMDGGPDYTEYDYRLFWFGARRSLLEVPLCRSVVGWGGSLSLPLYRSLSGPSLMHRRARSLATRLRFAERITLSPEGNDIAAMSRLVRRLRARGQTALALSFHSSSLSIGHNPYVNTRADLHCFYDRLSGILDYMANTLHFTFTSLQQMPDLLQPPPEPETAA